jgi:hypothetical protein
VGVMRLIEFRWFRNRYAKIDIMVFFFLKLTKITAVVKAQNEIILCIIVKMLMEDLNS